MEQLQNEAAPAVLYQSHTTVPEACRKSIASIHGTFARELTTQLSAYLRTALTVKFVGLKECTFAHFLSARQTNSCAASIKALPLDAKLIMDLEPPLLFTFVEIMLGGKAAARVVPDRPPTEIEKQLLAPVLKSMTSQLERAWGTLAAISLQFIGIETNALMARPFAPPDAAIVARFEVTAGELTGSFTVLTPTHAAETLTGSAGPDPAEDAETPEATRIAQTLMESFVRFDVLLEGVSLKLRDLVQLREGHVIKFDFPTDRDLLGTLNGVAGFPGQVVSTGRKRAFLIQGETAYIGALR